jgi:hypothetical protein
MALHVNMQMAASIGIRMTNFIDLMALQVKDQMAAGLGMLTELKSLKKLKLGSMSRNSVGL